MSRKRIPGDDIHTQLTLGDRDVIDGAKARLRGCVTLLARLTEHDEFDADDPENRKVIGVLIDDLSAAVTALDETFEAADARNAPALGIRLACSDVTPGPVSEREAFLLDRDVSPALSTAIDGASPRQKLTLLTLLEIPGALSATENLLSAVIGDRS